MSINTNSEFEKVKNKFNQLIGDGKDFGDGLKRGKKNNKKIFSCILKSPLNSQDKEIRARRQEKEFAKEYMKSFAEQVFKHYEVNPSSIEHTDKILKTYVNENLTDMIPPYLKISIPDIVNENDKLFNDINTLMERIKNNEDIDQDNRIKIITGIRGAGKTSYLNYFISNYEKKLNEKNIITIRINVLRINDDNVSLEDAIKFKLCRILFTYYCTWKKKGHERLDSREVKPIIDKYLLDILKDDNNKYSADDIEECSDYFKKHVSKEPKKIKHDSEKFDKICDLLLDLMVQDYKFIIMIDNFDQVYLNDKKKFDKCMAGILTISTFTLFEHCIYIIAMRDNTYKILPPPIRMNSSCFLVGSPTTLDMFNKRINYFATISESELKDKKINCLKNLIILIGNNFLPNTNSMKSPINFEVACELFDNIFYGNKRMLINMMQRFIDFIPNHVFEKLSKEQGEINYDSIFEKLISQTGYKFFESLLIDVNTGFCNCFYDYTKKDREYQFSTINPSPHLDEMFIPNIYSFPAILNSEEDQQFIPFLKIRILQLLKNNTESFSQKKIATKLSDIFGYRTDITHLACEELRWDQCISIKMHDPGDDQGKEIRELTAEITQRGENLLEILSININLLAVSLENVFFPKEFIDKGIPIGNYYNTDDSGISKFIIRNIFFSLPKTIGILSSIEEFEKEVQGTRIAKNIKKCFNDSDFVITKKLKEISNNSIESIYFTYFDNNYEDVAILNKRRAELNKQLGI